MILLNVEFSDLFTDNFMQENTAFANLNEFFDAVHVTDEESLLALPDDKLEFLVTSSTNFSSWSKMQEAAATEYLSNKLEF